MARPVWTSTGVVRTLSAVAKLPPPAVPPPPCPVSLYPQHLMPPAAVTAQPCWAWGDPVPRAATPLPRPDTSTEVGLSVVVPFPSWPRMLLPQQLTPPAAVRAQVWRKPAAMVATPLPRPETFTGVGR